VTAPARRTALVTGARGFVGSAIARRLRADGWLVTGIDLPQLTHHDPGRDCRDHDLTDPLPAQTLAGVELVIHAAGLAGVQPSWRAPRDYWRANVEATRLLREACQRGGMPRVIQLSSISVYGEGAGMCESSPTRPLSPYGISKLAAERVWAGYRGGTVLRLSNVYGPGQRPDMAYATFLSAALRGRRIELRDGGVQLRTPTYIDDCVDGIIAAATAPARAPATAPTRAAATAPDRSGTYNIAGPQDVRLLEVPALLGRLLGRPVASSAAPPAPGDPRTATVSSARARRELGYAPSTLLRDGLARQLEAARGPIGQSRSRAATA
jgi:nucleoside-diphosphate-sugar epimerase